jgi:cell division inhibitor SulA
MVLLHFHKTWIAYPDQYLQEWMKENGLKIDRWTNIEKCEIDNTLLADIFHL